MATLAERFEVWEREPPADLVGDPIWRLPAFRIAVFIAAVSRDDAVQVRSRADMHLLADQLVRAAASISANIAEGYSRLRGKERARYFEIALGSAREAREWYRGAGSVLGQAQAAERAALLTRAIKIPHGSHPGGTQRLLRKKDRRLPATGVTLSTAQQRVTSNQQPAATEWSQHPALAVSNQQPALLRSAIRTQQFVTHAFIRLSHRRRRHDRRCRGERHPRNR